MQALIALFLVSLSVSNAAPPKAPNARAKKNVILEERSERGSLKETKDTVDSLTLLLKRTAPNPSPQRSVLLLNRAASISLWARLKMLDKSTTNPTAELKKTFGLAIKDANEVLSSPHSSSVQLMKAHDILGVCYLYLDENRKARFHFLEVLKMNPKPDKAGWIGLVIAEDYFDEEDYKLAAEFYSKYLPLMSPQGKDLATYKLGWCMLNMSRPDEAEKYFAEVAKSKGSSGVGKDAIRDLAFLVTRRVDPLPSIKRAEAYFSALPEKLEFLHAVRMNLESENSIQLHTLIVERLLKMETDPEKSLDLALSNLRVQRKLYASVDHMNAFLKVQDLLDKMKRDQGQTLFKKFDSVIENELQALMKSYLDTFAGRTKTLEKLSKSDLAESLKKQFHFYHSHFTSKAGYPAVITAWSDICHDVRDWVCVDEASEIVLNNPTQLSKFSERAYLDEIAALDSLLGEKKTKDKSDLAKRRDLRIRQFVEKYPKSPQWIRVAKLYSQSEIDHGNVPAAIPILSQILNLEPSEDSFYRLQYARFQLKKYDEIVGDPRAKDYLKPDSKVAELYRESSLILAQNARGSKKAEDYKKNISEFVRLSNDPQKVRIARSDYFNFLNEQGSGEAAALELLALPPEEAKHKDWENLRVDLWRQMIEKGRFDEALRLAKMNSENSDGLQRLCLTALFLNTQKMPAEVMKLSDSVREYFFGLFALTQPDWLIDYYLSLKRGLKSSEKNLANLSLKIKTNHWKIERGPKAEALLGTDYAFADAKIHPLLFVEKQIATVTFPNMNKLSQAEQAKSVQFILGQVHSIRDKVAPGIKGKPAVLQLRVLEKARDLENKMAQFLLNSPIPKQITPEQIEEYKKGLASAAEEFTEHAKQFDGLAEKIKGILEEDRKWFEDRTLGTPDMAKWNWPTGSQEHSQLQWVFKLLKSGNKLGALALIDFYRDKYLKKDADYFSMRSGVLLSQSPTETIRIYLLDELEKNDQKELVNSWKSLVGRIEPVKSEAK